MNTVYLLSFTQYLEDSIQGVFATNEDELKKIVKNYWETMYFGTKIEAINVLIGEGTVTVLDEDGDEVKLYIHQIVRVA